MPFKAIRIATLLPRRPRGRHLLARVGVLAVLVALLAGTVATPAFADSSGLLDITKTVDRATDAPGDSFTYSITVDCSEAACVNATLTDVLPARFNALTLGSTAVTPPVAGAGSTVSWGGANNRTLTVNFTQSLPGGGVGIAAGAGYTVQVTMTVPASLSPDFGSNNVAVTNTASVAADNAATQTASANVTIAVPYSVATAVTNTWSPTGAQYKVGAPSTMTLTVANASNALATSLVLQDPADPTASSNPFEDADFASFGALTLPQGADEVFVDAWVAGAWVTGTTPETASTLALPSGVSAADVDGLRFRFDSSSGNATLTAGGTAGSVVLDVTQRASTRTGGNSLVLGTTITNAVSGTVTVPGQASATKTASATYTVTGLNAIVSASNTVTPATIPSGGSVTELVTAGNSSNGPLATLTVTAPASGSFFSAAVTFGGFTAASTFPSGATGATVTWSVNQGAAPAPSSFTSAATMPAAPSLSAGQFVTGFAISYTGAIATGATAVVAFRVNATGDANTDAANPLVLADLATVTGTNDAGSAAPASASAGLSILAPQIVLTEVKTVSPTAPVAPGGQSTVQLKTTTSSSSGYLPPTSITVTDLETGSATDYWNAFNAVAIAPTQVPLGSTLQPSYTTDGTTWTNLPLVDATTAAVNYTYALPSASSIIGLRFVFSNSNGFAASSIVSPDISFEARDTLRDGTGPTATAGTPVSYTNQAVALGSGTVTLQDGSTQTIQGTATATTDGAVKALPASDNGTFLTKKWQAVGGTTAVSSQSGQSRVALLLWGTQSTGVGSVVLSDPADPSQSVASTVFQAFDLTAVNAITPATDPSIAFDQVTSVQLVSLVGGTLTYTTVGTCTSAANNPCAGTFPGYTLTTAQVASTIGVQITITPDDALRASSKSALAPPVGSGITTSPSTRPLGLTFQLRNQLRDSTMYPTNPWVVAGKTYNTADAGVVSNSATATYATSAGPETDSASDSISIIDSPPAISSTKTVTPTTMPIPHAGDVPDAGYPTATYTLTATNASVARAWDMRVTDPMPCPSSNLAACANNDSSDGLTKGETVNPYAIAVYDPTTNPFEDFQIVSIVSTVPASISLANSTVDLLYYTPATATAPATTTTVSDVPYSSLATTDLTGVVGFSIEYASTSTTNGGTIASGAVATTTLTVRLLRNTRSTSALATPTLVTATTVTNNSFSQDYDHVLPDAGVYDSKSATIALNTGTIAVTATKTMKTVVGGKTTILEANRSANVAVTLGATSGSSDAASDRVVITDDGQSSQFWGAFTLASIGTITPPAGANQVEIDAQVDGSSSWTTQAPIAFTSPAAPSSALPPGVTVDHVTGLRFIFTKTDGSLFSNTAPAGTWSASVPLVANLRSTYLAGSTFAGTVSNSEVATSTHPTFGTATATATATITLATGTFSVDIVKTPSVATTPAGQDVDWTETIKNTGTGYLSNPTIVDQLPVDSHEPTGSPLVFDPTSVPTYTDSAGGILSTTSVSQTYSASAHRVTYSWPAGARLAPGESYTIVLTLEVAPGLQSTYGNVVNTFIFGSDQTLASCTNKTGNQGFHLAGTTCSTTNFVTTLSASSITTFKGVKGNVDSSGNSTAGAVNVSNPGTPCVSNADGFYRSPCAANSVVGGTDEWELQLTNGGNIPATAATIVDVLPHNGDTFLRSSTARGSTYTPSFAGDLALATDALSAGTTMTWDVTEDASPCQGYSLAPTCPSANWTPSTLFSPADYGKVTAIRVTFDFTNDTTSPGTLPPAAGLTITYDTVNTPSRTAGDHRASTTAPVTGAFAWNTFGAYAEFGTSFASRLVEPVKAGVELASGSIQVAKVITGPSAAFAPVSYSVTATCTVAGAPVTLPNGGVLTLTGSSTVPFTGRFDGIPVGAVCDVVEGASGASSVAYSPARSGGGAAEVTVATPGTSSDAVPTAQQVTVTNTYGMTSLTITKRVSTTTTVGTFGPYSFTLSCAVNNGATSLPVTFDDGTKLLKFILTADASLEVDNLPVDALCSLVETDSSGATSIAAVVDGGAPIATTQGGTVHITLAPGAAHTAVITNTFAGGQLAITKTVVESTLGGDPVYASGPYTVNVTCTYDGQTLYSATGAAALSIDASETDVLTPVFPVGTSCAVAELDARGATSSTAPATVLIPGPTGGKTVGLVTTDITNTFAKGSLTITKSVLGAASSADAISAWGAGPFEATVTCVWYPEGPTGAALTIPLPHGGVVSLAGDGSTATVTGLIAGADCSVAESKTGGATISSVGSISPATIPAGGTSHVTITNTYRTGSLVISKVLAGPADAVTRFGAGPFTAHVDCSYLKDGVTTAIDLGAAATRTFSAANGFTQTISGILVGATCSVAETDDGYAVSSALSPSDGTVTIVDPLVADPAAVTITNTFAIGALQVVKSASTELTEGSGTYDYTLAVSNTGTVSAPGVSVADAIDPTLRVTSVAATGWHSCAVTGADSDGYGGELDCVLDDDLAGGATAPAIVFTVSVLDTIAKDEIDNTADVTSTSPLFDPSPSNEVAVKVKWLEVTAVSTCTKDAPYLGYTIVAHNLDVSGHVLSVAWADKNGTLIHTDTRNLSTDGTIEGQLLWPGAAVDAKGWGIAWPGYRTARPGETAEWNGLVLDPTAYAYGLRDDPQITFSINPHRTVTVAYPTASATCTAAEPTDIALTKTASVDLIQPGVPFTYTLTSQNVSVGAVVDATLTDPIPASLHVTDIVPARAAAGMPAWKGCRFTGVNADGGGGTVTCVLDRPLLHGERAPDVVLTTYASKTAPIGLITNTATMTADAPATASIPTVGDPVTMMVKSSARVIDTPVLGYTGVALGANLLFGVGLLALGLVLFAVTAIWTVLRRRLVRE